MAVLACATIRIAHLQLVGVIMNDVLIITDKMVLVPTQIHPKHDRAAIVL